MDTRGWTRSFWAERPWRADPNPENQTADLTLASVLVWRWSKLYFDFVSQVVFLVVYIGFAIGYVFVHMLQFTQKTQYTSEQRAKHPASWAFICLASCSISMFCCLESQYTKLCPAQISLEHFASEICLLFSRATSCPCFSEMILEPYQWTVLDWITVVFINTNGKRGNNTSTFVRGNPMSVFYVPS